MIKTRVFGLAFHVIEVETDSRIACVRIAYEYREAKESSIGY